MLTFAHIHNFVDVKQIYVNKIGQTYIVTRHNNQVFALRVEVIITEEFLELFRVHDGHLELLKLLKGDTSTPL